MTPYQREAYSSGNEAAKLGMPRNPPVDMDRQYETYWLAGYDGEAMLVSLAQHIASMGRSKGMSFLEFMGRKRGGKNWHEGEWYVDMKERIWALWRKK